MSDTHTHTHTHIHTLTRAYTHACTHTHTHKHTHTRLHTLFFVLTPQLSIPPIKDHVTTACRAASVLKEELEALKRSLHPSEQDLPQEELPQQSLDPPHVHPNDHVNMGQSSNDTIPTVWAGSKECLVS